MTARVVQQRRDIIEGLIIDSKRAMLSAYDKQMLDMCLAHSAQLYVGLINNEFVCAWGLIPPTLLADYAYLWLYHTDAVKDNTFLFVRNSQRVVEQMLMQYPTIIGHTDIRNPQSMRWLRWLGAKFDKPAGFLAPFVIRKQEHGSV